MGLLNFLFILALLPAGNTAINKAALKEQAYNLFMHGYRSYMNHAYPADELMPLTCQGRFRGVTPSRGDVDDSLGNFSLTLVDTLDTLVVLGELDEFERAVKLVVDNVRLDSDLIVSVFETNIRVLGGLLSGHLMAELVKSKDPSRLAWYTDRQLLKMAIDIGDRLLPAFNTTSGIPYSRINLRHGMSEYLQRQKDTCTACGGTMLLEMAALSRLSGNPVYEQKARKAMDFLWSQRHRSSDLMGTVLNVHSGDWVRRESGIGAGIDSYYEYCLKSYILLGDHSYLERFNKHYDAVMRYVNKGPLFVDVHMHRPTVATRQFMDALLAFWPGLQVLKGDVKEAIEMHEMLFQVVKKHKFLPEAFTHDFQVHWGEHPLRPEFIESTYFLYRATRDEHYLEVAQQVMESIEKYVKVKCGFAAVKDVRVMTHEDRMDSFVLSETFKYLYMIFAEPEDLIFDPDNYVLTTEAHFLPLSMGVPDDSGVSRRVFIHPGDVLDPKKVFISANPVRPNQIPTAPDEANKIRTRTRNVLEELFVIQGQVAKEQCVKPSERLRAWAFSSSNADHIRQLREMGIEIQFQEDGRMLLSHTTASGGVVRCAMDMHSSETTFNNDGMNTSAVHLNQMASSNVLAKAGIEFMQEMAVYAATLEKENGSVFQSLLTSIFPVLEQKIDYFVQLLSPPYFGIPYISASPAQYGPSLMEISLEGEIAVAEPFRGCTPLTNPEKIRGRIAVLERSECMFHEKTRHAQIAGAVGVIIIDHMETAASQSQPPFAMAGDKNSGDDVVIPSLFLYRDEGEKLLYRNRKREKPLIVRLATYPVRPEDVMRAYFNGVLEKRIYRKNMMCDKADGNLIEVDKILQRVTYNLRLEHVTQDSEPKDHQEIVERHVSALEKVVAFENSQQQLAFSNLLRTAAYGALGLNIKDEDFEAVSQAISTIRISDRLADVNRRFDGDITKLMFYNGNQQQDIEESHKRINLCVPGTGPSDSISYSSNFYDSASPLFNCSIDYSLNSYQTSFSLDFSFECSSSYCTCKGQGICRFCLPVTASTSAVSVGPLSLRLHSSLRRRGSRSFVNRDEQKLSVLRGVSKQPKFYRTTKIRNMNETALLFSLNRSRTPCSSPSRACPYSRGSRYSNRGLMNSKIPMSTAITAMFEQERRAAETLQEAVEELNTMNFGQMVAPAVENDISMLELTNSLSNTTLGSIPKNYEDDLCHRIHDLPLKESSLVEPQLNVTQDLVAVNSLLQHIESFTVQESPTPSTI